MYTTLRKIEAISPCERGWRTLLRSLGKKKPDDEPLSLLHILTSNGVTDAFWALRAFDKQDCVKLAFAAARVQATSAGLRELVELIDSVALSSYAEEGISRLKDYLYSRKPSNIKERCAFESASCAVHSADGGGVGGVAFLTEEAVQWNMLDCTVAEFLEQLVKETFP